MRLDEIVDALQELNRVLLLRTTGSKISHENAEKALAWLDEQGYRFTRDSGEGTKKTPGVGRQYLKIVAASWRNPGWRSGKGAVERWNAIHKLKTFGFKTSGLLADVKADEDGASMGANLPHVYFW